MRSLDADFTCAGCGGRLAPVGCTISDRRFIYNCDRCGNNLCYECTVCHKPRTIWADDGSVCGVCALETMIGRRSLSSAQAAGVRKWMVAVPLKRP